MRPNSIVAFVVAILVVVSFFALQVADQPYSDLGAAYAQQKKMKEMSEAEKKLAEIRKSMAGAKRQLTADGKYNCCIRPTCDFCALSVNKCPCATNVAKGMPVCGTCAGGWASGYGVVPDVDPAEVMAISGDMANMMYGMRAKMYGKKEGKAKEMMKKEMEKKE